MRRTPCEHTKCKLLQVLLDENEKGDKNDSVSGCSTSTGMCWGGWESSMEKMPKLTSLPCCSWRQSCSNKSLWERVLESSVYQILVIMVVARIVRDRLWIINLAAWIAKRWRMARNVEPRREDVTFQGYTVGWQGSKEQWPDSQATILETWPLSPQ